MLSILGTIVVLGLLTTVYIHFKSDSGKHTPDAVRALSTGASQSSYTDLTGKPIDIAQKAKSEVVVVTSWASWCPPCVSELGKINTLVDEFQGRPVRFLAINRSEPAHTARKFIDAYEISDQVTLVLDEDDRFFSSIEGYGMPETVLYDRDGIMQYQIHGEFSTEQLRREIEKLLADLE